MNRTEHQIHEFAAPNYRDAMGRLAASLADRLRSEVLRREDVVGHLRLQLAIDTVAEALENLISEEISGEQVTFPTDWWDEREEETRLFLEKEITDHLAERVARMDHYSTKVKAHLLAFALLEAVKMIPSMISQQR
jgi:hypothetical protein